MNLQDILDKKSIELLKDLGDQLEKEGFDLSKMPETDKELDAMVKRMYELMKENGIDLGMPGEE